MLYRQLGAAALFTLHFGLIGAVTGAAMNVVNIFRSVVFTHGNQRWARGRHWLYIFLAAFIIAGIYSWQGWYSILPIVAMTTGTLAFWMKDTHRIRRIALISPVSWLAYNTISGSYPGMVVEVMILMSIILAMLRFDLHKKSRAAFHISRLHLPHFGLHKLQLPHRHGKLDP